MIKLLKTDFYQDKGSDDYFARRRVTLVKQLAEVLITYDPSISAYQLEPKIIDIETLGGPKRHMITKMSNGELDYYQTVKNAIKKYHVWFDADMYSYNFYKNMRNTFPKNADILLSHFHNITIESWFNEQMYNRVFSFVIDNLRAPEARLVELAELKERSLKTKVVCVDSMSTPVMLNDIPVTLNSGSW